MHLCKHYIKFYVTALYVSLLSSCGDVGDVNVMGDQINLDSPGFLDYEDSSSANEDLNAKVNTEKSSLFQKLLNATVTVVSVDIKGQAKGFGSGVFITHNIIATNHHVIEGCRESKVKLSHEATEYWAEVVEVDAFHDVALLKVKDFSSNHIVKIQVALPEIGSDVIVSGSPEGLEGTITSGIISAIREFEGRDNFLLQISAPISPGSSGGPVINKSGLLVGISRAGFNSVDAQNLNFAVPARYIQELKDMIKM